MSLFDEPIELLPFDGSARYWEWGLGDRNSSEVVADLMSDVEWEQRRIVLFGREVDQPRLNSWYGDVAYTYSGITMTPRPWIPALTEFREMCERLSGARFNSVLVNLYRDGRDSMGWHADDEPELGREPTIASVSLGAIRRFRLRHNDSRTIVERELASGSVLVMSGACQHAWKHEVPKQMTVSEPRINLTFRWIHPELRRD